MNPEIYRPLIERFIQFIQHDPQFNENPYGDKLTLSYLENLSKEEFIEFFYSFHNEGGKIQSGGSRQGSRFMDMLKKNYKQVRTYLLEPFEEGFDPLEWLDRRHEYKPMGEGFCTVYLTRIDPTRFTVLNDKSIRALRELGFTVEGSTSSQKYLSIKQSQDMLLENFPDLRNYYVTDYFNHYILNIEDGVEAFKEIKKGKNSQSEDPSEFFKSLIYDYKIHLKVTNLKDELFKWKAIKHFQETWNPEASDFGKMFQEAIRLQYNLINYLNAGMIGIYCRERPNDWKMMILDLYNEDEDLAERINQFRSKASILAKELNKDWHISQDERALSLYLAFRFPEKYILYKNSFYQLLAKKMGVNPEKAGNRYIHFQTIAQTFKSEYILKDNELLELYQKELPNEVYQDPESNLLTQDILYFMETRSIDAGPNNYWIFQANPKVWRIIEALKNDDVTDWSVRAHKDEIKIGDKVILWVTGDKSGCYALGSVQSEVFRAKDDDIDLHYSVDPDENNESDRVELNIELNLYEKPILKEEILNLSEFKNFKVGSQGTNFTATKKQYETLLNIAMEKIEPGDGKKYWIIAPGRDAQYWQEFHNEGIIAIGWDEIGDLRNFKTQLEIETFLKKADNVSGRKYNDAKACFEFANRIQIGDIVIVKQGRKVFLGYGIVKSDYYFDKDRDVNKHIRKVEWIKTGHWNEDFGTIALKTLTDITRYPTKDPNYKYYYERILALINKEANPLKKVKIDKGNYSLNLILHGPPGTGKTYETIDLAVDIIDGKMDSNHEVNKRRFDELRLAGQIEFITFHQNYAYEDFVIGLRPDPGAEELHFISHKGIFYKICKLARENYEAIAGSKGEQLSFEDALYQILEPLDRGENIDIKMASGSKFKIYDATDRTIRFEKPNGSTAHSLSISTLKEIESGGREMISGLAAYYQPMVDLITKYRKQDSRQVDLKKFVLIIDEINRANISRVFGELITLLEEDKRIGGDNELLVTLPSGEKNFGVPPNLFIIGTMNTADKSIALLDIALRRRFEFIGKYPVYNKLSPDVADKLRKLNVAIKELKKSPDFMIGHAYFINENDESFTRIMNNKIIPLLYEYFNGRENFVEDILKAADLNIIKNEQSFLWTVQ